MPGLRTTRPIRPVRGLDDIRAIESRPYDENVTARTLYDLLLATAETVGDRPALTVLRSPEPDDVGTALTHAGLLARVTQAANLFRALGLDHGTGVAAFLTPTLPDLPPLLLGAQVAGVASTINYLLSATAIADLLNAEAATILVIPAPHLDPDCWDKARGLLSAVPSLRHVLVIGGAAPLPDRHAALDPLRDAARADALDFPVTAGRDTVCALFHTGGTTGRPKLVPLTHGNQIHAAFGFGQVFGYDETDTVLNGFPFFHVGGTMTAGLSVLAAGGAHGGALALRAPPARGDPVLLEARPGFLRHRRQRRADLALRDDDDLRRRRRRRLRPHGGDRRGGVALRRRQPVRGHDRHPGIRDLRHDRPVRRRGAGAVRCPPSRRDHRHRRPLPPS